ncbi:anhydro-N-acetylmuramic acid kinase-like [Amblyomma americanum]
MPDYRVIGVMSGSSLDGLDIIYVTFQVAGDTWKYKIEHTICQPYGKYWVNKLQHAVSMNALEYQLFHTEYGRYLGDCINIFIRDKQLQGKVDLVACHGHTVFHLPGQLTTTQVGDGAAVAAVTGLPTVSDFRSVDVALEGQGSPFSLAAERKLFGSEYQYFLNIGGMACLTYVGKGNEDSFAVDVCPANQLLNLLAEQEGKTYDDEGKIAASGTVNARLLKDLDGFTYYKKPLPKSLGVDFGPEILYPLISARDLPAPDALRTFTAHICNQVVATVCTVKNKVGSKYPGHCKMLVTGGGARNLLLVAELTNMLKGQDITVTVPEDQLVKFKEALMTAVLGVLRVREEVSFFSKVSGAKHDSVGGALWCGATAQA